VGTHSALRHASDEAACPAELTALRVQAEEQEQEIRTLRSQLALARAEVQELKAESRSEPEPSVRVSGGEQLPWAREERPSLGMQPVLHLDGRIVDERLPITNDVPDLPLAEESQPAHAEGAERSRDSIEGYRRALGLIQAQRFDQALSELDAFASEHPSHPYADNALFWCGEIHYLRGRHDQALRYFERIEKLYPWGNKAADALYRMGQIHLRRGNTAGAQTYFEKVREQFPDTAAARLAQREDAS
jgi:tol-pal system protein YbgF